MELGESNALFYKRAHFVTRLPLDRLYTSSHYWLFEQQGSWRIGLTKFGTHLLGEIVDYGFDVQPGAAIRTGQFLGWIEGFKAVSDLVCVFNGTFRCANPHLSRNTEAIDRDCYGEGWLYEAAGQPGSCGLRAEEYVAYLDATIEGLLEKRRSRD
jgi:glycine cleavage system H protein